MKHNTEYFSKISILLAAACLFFLSQQTQAQDNFRQRINQLNADTSTLEDIETEVRFGQEIAARILGRLPLHEDGNLIRYVSLVGKSLARQSPRDEIEFHFAVVQADFVNAYSAPGGYIFITSGALKSMKDESELAAALAHEIAHITQKHIVKEFNIKASDTSGASSFGRLLGGSSDTARVAFSQAVDKAMEILFEKGFAQQDELSADREATILLASTGYDPTALKRYLSRIADNKKNSGNTHPPSTERTKNITSLLIEEGLEKVSFPRGTKRFNQYVN